MSVAQGKGRVDSSPSEVPGVGLRANNPAAPLNVLEGLFGNSELFPSILRPVRPARR